MSLRSKYQSVIEQLLNSSEPSIRWKIRTNVLGEKQDSPEIKKLQTEIKTSPRVKALLANRGRTGRMKHPGSIYDKWQGAHWVMAALADIGYPPGDKSLLPMKKQVAEFWLSESYYLEFETDNEKKAYQQRGVPKMEGRYRRCASQQGNALYSILKLALQEKNDKSVEALVERLLCWQWPDGGWNCDKRPKASQSSFMETLIPLRGLSLYAKINKDRKTAKAAKKAAEVFLRKRLFKSERTGEIIHKEFVKLHYPVYWHYDILGGLKVMAETGFIKDKRCNDALDLLESKYLPDGGWPAESRYYKATGKMEHGQDYTDWGGTSSKKMNEWITADALFVLKSSGRL